MKRTIQAVCRLAILLLTVQTGATAGGPTQPPQPPRPDQGLPDKLPAILAAEPMKAEAGDDELRRLLKARYNEDVAELKARLERLRAGQGTVDSLAGVSQRLLQSGLDLTGNAEERVKLLQGYLDLTREIERIKQALVEAMRATNVELHQARRMRIDAEIRLLRARREAAKKPGK